MTPIFTEKESNGIYEANLKVTMDTIHGKDTDLGQRYELHIQTVKDRWISSLVKAMQDTGISLPSNFDDFLIKEKKLGIDRMYEDMNKRIELEKQMLNDRKPLKEAPELLELIKNIKTVF